MKTKPWRGIAMVCLALSGNAGIDAQGALAQADAAHATQTPVVDPAKLAPLTPNAGDGDYTIQPPYADAPELTPREGTPKGTVYRFTLNSADSKIYPGISKTAPG